MSTDALAQAFTRLISSEEFVSEVREDEDAALGSYDLSKEEAGLLAEAAHEGVEMMGDGEGRAMKRIGAQLQGDSGQITEETQAALGDAVQERMRAQLERIKIDPQMLK
jgi:hypothetical protein